MKTSTYYLTFVFDLMIGSVATATQLEDHGVPGRKLWQQQTLC